MNHTRLRVTDRLLVSSSWTLLKHFFPCRAIPFSPWANQGLEMTVSPDQKMRNILRSLDPRKRRAAIRTAFTGKARTQTGGENS